MEPQKPHETSPSIQPNNPNEPVASPKHKQPSKLTEQAEKLKKLSIQVMIGGLIAAAALAVIAVLAGSFSNTFKRALFTLFLVIIHALACLAFVEQTGRTKKPEFRLFENSVFFIIILSFFTSIFGVWRVLDGNIVAKLYGTYGVLLFAYLHGQMLIEAHGKKESIDRIIDANYVMMCLVILLILPILWLYNDGFPNFYYRLLAACGIIDATLTILAVILHRLYIQKHPEIQSNIFTTQLFDSKGQPVIATQAIEKKRHLHPLIWILGILIVAQIVISLLFAISGAFYR